LLVIRLARAGRSKYPTYRLVAAESARAATGKFVAVLGHYNPHTKELVIKREEIEKHLSNGAQPSNTVVKLLTREKVTLPDWVKLKVKAPKSVESDVTEAEPTAAASNDEAPAEAEKPVEAAKSSETETVSK
jgi:small subunit ribosomal protein S16